MKVFLWVVVAALAGTFGAMEYGALPTTYAGLPVGVITASAAVALFAYLLAGLVGKTNSSGSRRITTDAKPAARGGVRASSTSDDRAARLQARAAEAGERQAQVARNTAVLKAAVLEQPATTGANKVRVDGAEGRYIEVESGNNAETGALEVTVTAYNYSGSKFNTHVHNRLLKIKGVKWESPKNLGGGETNRKRQIKGAVVSAAMSDVLSGIAAIK